MENEGLPPLPMLTPEVMQEETTGVKVAIRAIRDFVVILTMRVAEEEKLVAHNIPKMGFEESRGQFTRAINQTVRSNTTKPLTLSYNGDGDPHLFLDSLKSYTNARHLLQHVSRDTIKRSIELVLRAPIQLDRLHQTTSR